MMTLAIAATGYVIGSTLGAFLAWGKVSGGRVIRGFAETYTTVLRGIPDLLVIYLFYFGGSLLLTKIMRGLGGEGFLTYPDLPQDRLPLVSFPRPSTPKCFAGPIVQSPPVKSKRPWRWACPARHYFAGSSCH